MTSDGMHTLAHGLIDAGLELESDDDLLRVISELEGRLESIRQSHRQQQMLEVDVLEAQGVLATREQALRLRERDLLSSVGTIEDQEAVIATERTVLQEQRETVERRKAELARMEQQLREQQQGQAVEADELERARAEVESLRSSLGGEEHAMREREAALQQRIADLEQQRDAIDQGRAEVEREKAQLAEQAAEQEKLSGQLEQMRQELQAREAEIQERFSEHEKLRDMLSTLSRQLDESKDEARKHAEQYEQTLKQKKEDEQRAQNLETRCRSLERERTKIRGELTKVRRELDDAMLFQNESQARRMARAISSNRRAQIAAGTWLATTILVGMGGFLAVAGGSATIAATVAGIALATLVLVSHTLVGRLWDSSTFLIASVAATAGLWFPHWAGAVEVALSSWHVAGLGELLSEGQMARAPLAAAAVGAGLMLTVAIFLLTSSAAVLGHALFATLAAGTLLLFGSSGVASVAALVMWQGIVAATVSRWAIRVSALASRG